jgi:cytochrome c-type biogenesis protein CcmH
MGHMWFWIVTGAMAVAVAGTLGTVLWRGGRGAADDAASYDLRVYRDQLAEVDRDLARGVLAPDDADRVRTEIKRRILAADAARPGGAAGQKGRTGHLVAAAVLVAVAAGSVALYARLGAPGYGDLALADRIAGAERLRAERPDQDAAEARMPSGTVPQSPEITEETRATIDQLRDVVASRPDDAEGHRLLALWEGRLGDYAAAWRAYDRFLELREEPATAAEYAELADLMVMAAGGYVSPEAEAVLEKALMRDATQPVARYFWGLMEAQTGRPDRAFRLWDRLLREGPADAPWISPIEAQIAGLARRAGVDYTPPEAGSGALPGPSRADIEAAGEMTGEERMAMIEGMVQGLSERLATEGGSADEWARLITALSVLGRADRAAAIYAEAREKFGADPGGLDQIDRAAERAGIAQ